jgi:dihydroflavonol-4-reductase
MAELQTVFLTGASGFIAKHIVLQLLNAGYQVRGSVRSLDRADEVRAAIEPHLVDPSDLSQRLSFVALDLGSDAGWAEAMQGCEALLHTASPFPLAQPRNEQDLIRPAVDGTLRALKAASAAGIERVVLTSSAVAVMYGRLPPGKLAYDEADWSDDADSAQNAYGRSKTQAEQAAWAYVRTTDPSMRLTTINPVLVVGPALDRHYGTSLSLMERMYSGKDPMQPRFGIPLVDVRDVAAMHVRALGAPDSVGRRLLASDRFMWMSDIAAVIKEAYPGQPIKVRIAPDFVIKAMSFFDKDISTIVPQLGVIREVSNARARSVLGMEFIPARDAILASCASVEAYSSRL